MQGRVLRALVPALAMLVVPASASAMQSQFITTKKGIQEPLKVRGASGTEGEQTLYLAPFTVACQAARVSGEPAPGYFMLRNYIKLSRCTTTVSAGEETLTLPAKVNEAIDAFYKGDGTSSWVNPVNVTIPSLKCTIEIAEGARLHNATTGTGGGSAKVPYVPLTVPNRNLREFPSGYQKRLEIDNHQVGLSYSFAGGCANLQPPSQPGEYVGKTVEEASGGNLEFVPGAEYEQVQNEKGAGEEGGPEHEEWNLEKVGGS
jgi:hypothetical protein